MSAKLLQCQCLWYGWTNQSIHFMVFCRQNLHNKELSSSKSEKGSARLYLNELKSILHALSDALPAGHWALANTTLQLHFVCGSATLPESHTHKLAIREDAIFFINGQKIFLPIKTEINFDACMILQKPVLSLKGNDLKKRSVWRWYHLLPHKVNTIHTFCAELCTSDGKSYRNSCPWIN